MVQLNHDATAGDAWIGGRKIGVTGESATELPAGTHRGLVRIDPQKIPNYIRLNSADSKFLVN